MRYVRWALKRDDNERYSMGCMELGLFTRSLAMRAGEQSSAQDSKGTLYLPTVPSRKEMHNFEEVADRGELQWRPYMKCVCL